MLFEKDENVSDEEGFFAEHIQIRHSDNDQPGTNNHSKSHFNRSPFEAKYLPWTGVMKKQPQQALKVSKKIISQEGDRAQRKKTRNNIQEHPYTLYATNPSYQLVYSRTKGEPILNESYFMNNQVKLQHIGSKNLIQFKKLKNFMTNQSSQIRPGALTFDSKFECGNLHCVYKLEKVQEYILFIQNDTNSLGYNQWFYFAIHNNEANMRYTFKIVNFKKKHSFFKYGCKPAVFSLHDAKKKGEGWSRRGKNIVYEQSPIYIPDFPDTKFYSLTFDLKFEHKNDYILVAMSLPYSYTKMISFLKQAELIAQEDELGTLQFSIKSVCRSICGNDVPEVTITRKSEEENKKMIIIMARQHPGEVWSSYMAEGMIRHLVSQPDQNMQWFLQNHIVKIFPMINVDGVVYGNFRCDITGVDLNRRWKQTSRLMYPQIYQIKRKISAYRSRHKIQCCFDLHGHSKNYNVFAYSCKNNQFTCRVLPLLISHINPTFYFPSCTFGISKYKQSTARAAIYKIIRNQNVLTIESSFYGSKLDSIIKQFIPDDLYKMGSDILLACKYFLDKKSNKYTAIKKQIETRINQFNDYDQINGEDSGSQSEPEKDQIDLEIKIKNIFNKNLVTLDQLKGVKPEKPAVLSPTKLKYEQETIQVKSRELKTRKKSGMPFKTNEPIKEVQASPPKPNIQTLDDGQFSLVPPDAPRVNLPNRNKKTISYSQQKSYDIQVSTEMKITNPLFRERQKKFSIHVSVQPKTERKTPQKLRPQVIKYKQSEQTQPYKMRNSIEQLQTPKSIEKSRDSTEFIKKFQKFIPASIINKNRANMSMFQESLYNEDQGNLITKLLENKKRIELEKIKRDVQQSTYLAQRQGKIKISNRKQKVVDYRAFKQNEKVNRQIRKLTSNVNVRYNQ